MTTGEGRVLHRTVATSLVATALLVVVVALVTEPSLAVSLLPLSALWAAWVIGGPR